MPTPLYLNGFENNVFAAGGSNTDSIWQTTTIASITPTRDTVHRGAGSYSMKQSVPGGGTSSQGSMQASFPAQTKLAFRFYFRKSGNPSQANCYIALVNPSGSIFFVVLLRTDGALQMLSQAGTSPVNGGVSGVLNNNQWYLVEGTVDVSTTAYKARLFVDGTAVSGDATQTGAAVGSLVRMNIGKVQAGTNTTAFDLYFDDFIVGYSTTDLNDRFGPTDGIVALVPNADGTHSPSPPVAGRFQDVAGVDISGANPAWDNLDSGDLVQTAERVAMPVAASTEYLEVHFTTTPLSAVAPVAVQGEIGLNTDGTNAFTASCFMYTGSGATSIVSGFDWSIAAGTKTYKRALVAVADQADLDGIRMRFGYGSAQPATPYWEALMYEVDIGQLTGPNTYFGAFVMPTTFGRTVLAQRRTFSSLVSPFTFGALTDGERKVFGQIAAPFIFSKEVQAQRKTFGQVVAPFIFSKDVRAQRKTFGQIALPINIAIATAGIRVGLTQYGVVSLPVVFGTVIDGKRKAFGQVVSPFVFSKDVRGQRKTFSQIIFPITFTKEALGQREAFGQLSMQTLFGKETAGRRKTFSQFAFPIAFSKAVAARKQTFGRIALPLDFLAFVDGQVFVGPKTLYGQFALPIVFDKQVAARRKTFGQVAAPFIFGSVSQAQRKTYGEFELPLDLEIAVGAGYIETFGQILLPISIDIDTDGRIKLAGIILNDAVAIYLGDEPVVAVYTDGQKVWPSV